MKLKFSSAPIGYRETLVMQPLSRTCAQAKGNETTRKSNEIEISPF
jgi:hypothetical protein